VLNQAPPLGRWRSLHSKGSSCVTEIGFGGCSSAWCVKATCLAAMANGGMMPRCLRLRVEASERAGAPGVSRARIEGTAGGASKVRHRAASLIPPAVALKGLNGVDLALLFLRIPAAVSTVKTVCKLQTFAPGGSRMRRGARCFRAGGSRFRPAVMRAHGECRGCGAGAVHHRGDNCRSCLRRYVAASESQFASDSLVPPR
jgi:hypothetical protein